MYYVGYPEFVVKLQCFRNKYGLNQKLVNFVFFKRTIKNSVLITPISEVSGVTFWENVTARYAVGIA